jgi:hypothetical protein
MSSGHNEQMNRSMGMDILKDNKGFILIQKISRLFSSNDLTEDAILFHFAFLYIEDMILASIILGPARSWFGEGLTIPHLPCLTGFCSRRLSWDFWFTLYIIRGLKKGNTGKQPLP